MKKLIFLFVLIPQYLAAQFEIVNHNPASNDFFSIINSEEGITIVYDSEDYKVTSKVASLFSSDIERISGVKPVLVSGEELCATNIILIGTVGKSRWINKLIAQNKINTDSLINQWERFLIQTIEKPFKGIDRALVIAGSDRRGTAYGVFTLSEKMGVSPWYWWADIPVKKNDELYIKNLRYISKSPSVKYRGIFINDEDWGIQPWAAKNIDTNIKDIGPKTYSHVCELLLRLKGNMLAPAMHSCTGAFYHYPKSKIVADEYGIIITTAHCEPLLFNNASKLEWDNERDGEWNYATNKKVILNKLDNRVKEAAPFENIYTVGMRGLHDEGLRGNHSPEEQVDILTNVIKDQRIILEKHLGKPADEIQQIFVPYKETMEIYERGLEIPDDVTLVWVDDNYGYMKRLSDPEEQKRRGNSGIYYHLSYLGPPHDYLWLNTTPPVLMYEELKKAYDFGANRYWLVNIGDIKPSETGLQTVLDLAFDVNKYDFESINQHQSRFLASVYGEKYQKDLQYILDNYYRLAWSRKPEFMGWEREWDAAEYRELKDTEYSFQHYNDARQRLADYKQISDMSFRILNELPSNMQPSFYQLVAYPVLGSCQMNRKFLLAQYTHEMIKEKKYEEANRATSEAKAAYDSINNLTTFYNTLLEGKWDGMMKVPPGIVAKYQNMPKVQRMQNFGEKNIDVLPQKEQQHLEGCTVIDLKKYKNKISNNTHTLRIINGIGYDWTSVQLGSATEKSGNPKNLNGSRFEYDFFPVNSDSVTVYVYSLPLFPVHKEKSNRFGISVDNQNPIVSENIPKEFSRQWKDQVLKNGVLTKASFPVNRQKKTHTLSLICGDPGTIIQRVVIDWGGLKTSYTGPGLHNISD